jgi:hypothetical protein
VAFEVTEIARKLDVAVNYDFSRARSTYSYMTGAVPDRTLPEEVILDSTLPTPTALPPTFSQLHRGTVDIVYSITDRIGVWMPSRLPIWRGGPCS